MSASTTVHVSGIAPLTTEEEVREFFSFCGRVVTLSITPSSNEPDASKSATVTFEKETAAKTALLLDNTQLGPAAVRVEAAHTIDEIAGSKATNATEARDEHGHEIEQEDKPRSRIIAEYLAHGYVVSDQAIQKAIALDNKHGISARFTNALTNFDNKYHATDRARGIDESYKITNRAVSGWRGINSYFENALGTPTGKKVREFYLKTDKQVRDIHTEARRLADLKSGRQPRESGNYGGESLPAYSDVPTTQAAQGSAGEKQFTPASATES